MSNRTNRLERWKTLAAAAVAREVAEYIGFALLRFYRGKGMQSAAALTYTTLLALVPLLAIGFAIFSAFPAFEAARTAVEDLIFENLMPELAGPVRTHLDGFMRRASDLGAFGTIGLAVSAILLLATIEATFNQIWRVERQRPFLTRFLTFWAVLTLGPILTGLTISSTSDVFTSLRQTWTDAGLDAGSLDLGGEVRDHVIAMVLQSIGFMLLFMVVPNRSVGWRDALIGGALSGAAFEGLKLGFGWYLTAFPTYQTIYGAMAAIPIFLIWVYVSWTVILLGAVFAASFPDWWRSRNLETEQELGAAHMLSVALSILAVLWRESKQGGPVRETALEDVAHAEAISQVLDRLQSAGFAVRTEDDLFALARDLSSATVYDLYRGLGCASAASEASITEIAPEIAELLEALSKAEEEALSMPVSTVLTALAGAKGNKGEESSLHVVAE
ncbi:YihY family inner membrane protein [Nisaea sp.]|uniref:YihY family inner membrane protein n=1 Tax=Nisaea sp. TaxID=2024842 RepID=UPI003B51BAE7